LRMLKSAIDIKENNNNVLENIRWQRQWIL
jgi:hypothetical protein